MSGLTNEFARRSLLISVACLLLICAIDTTCAQTTCTLKLAELPDATELMGFRLGMTKDQVKARVPHISFGKADDLGLAKITINPDFDSRFDKANFAGVRSISMDFLDEKLISVWLGYDSSFKWKTVDDFVKGISKSLHVPDAWQTWRGRGQQLKCTDFNITVSIIAEGPSLRIVDETAVNTFAERREAKEAAASEEPTEDEESATPPSVPDEIVGDKKTKTYLTNGCQPQRPIDGVNRVTFKTIEAAEAAGFKRSKDCQQ